MKITKYIDNGTKEQLLAEIDSKVT